MHQPDLPDHLQAWYGVSVFPLLLERVGETLTPRGAAIASPDARQPGGTRSAACRRGRHPVFHQHRRGDSTGRCWPARPQEARGDGVASAAARRDVVPSCPFSAGAFIPGVPVQPVVLRYPNQLVSTSPGPCRGGSRTSRRLRARGFSVTVPLSCGQTRRPSLTCPSWRVGARWPRRRQLVLQDTSAPRL